MNPLNPQIRVILLHQVTEESGIAFDYKDRNYKFKAKRDQIPVFLWELIFFSPLPQFDFDSPGISSNLKFVEIRFDVQMPISC